VVRPAFFVLPHREAAWKILKERMDTLAEAASNLAAEPGLGALAEIAGNLRTFSAELQGHIQERALNPTTAH
jgi:hypothetical protein